MRSIWRKRPYLLRPHNGAYRRPYTNGPKQRIKNQKINKIDIISHNETPGYYEEVYKNMTVQIIETQSLNIDGVSGATVTSRAFINGVKSGLSQALDNE